MTDRPRFSDETGDSVLGTMISGTVVVFAVGAWAVLDASGTSTGHVFLDVMLAGGIGVLLTGLLLLAGYGYIRTPWVRCASVAERAARAGMGVFHERRCTPEAGWDSHAIETAARRELSKLGMTGTVRVGPSKSSANSAGGNHDKASSAPPGSVEVTAVVALPWLAWAGKRSHSATFAMTHPYGSRRSPRPGRTTIAGPSSSQDGSAPIIELALGAPVLLVVVWMVIWAGTGGQTPGQVRLAAQDAARLASTIRVVDDRPSAARNLVDARLAGDADCSTWTTAVASTSTAVTVTVDCRLATDQMAALRVPSRTVAATGRSSIDTFFLQDGR